MVEGHQCHRVAHAHRKLLLGRPFAATSPNKRFAEGAAAVDGKPLSRIEVHGKNLFYFFGDPACPVVVHIHFGMSGAFKTTPLPGPEPTETTRLRLVNEELGVVALLSAMTVQHGDMAFYESKASKLGADPLREDADPEAAWRRVSTSKKPIGLLLMDQSVVAGVGNIYRAEILFKAGVHPEQPGWSVGRATFDEVWRHSVLLLQRGFQTGSILTVDPEEAAVLGSPWTRRYVYNHKSCGRCGGAIRSWDMAGRTAYACEGCQPLAGGEAGLAAGRAKALGAAKQAKEFVSHCAPDDPSALPPSKMTALQLRAALAALGLQTAGRKAELAVRLAAAEGAVQGGTAAAAATAEGAVVEEGTPAAAGGGRSEVKQVRARRGRAAAEQQAATPDAAAEGGAPPSAKEETPAPKAGAQALKEEAQVQAAGLPGELCTPSPRKRPGRGGAWVSPELYAWDQYVPGVAAVQAVVHAAPLAGAAAAEAADAPAAAGGAPAAPAEPAAQSGAAGASRTRRLGRAGQGEAEADAGVEADVEGAGGAAEVPKRRRLAVVVPGTRGLGPVATAEEAAAEKARAGEGRNVEHVALHTPGLLQSGTAPAEGEMQRRQGRSARERRS